MKIPISGKTKLAGVIGWPIGHTLSPAMHNAAFAALGMDAVYLPLGVPDPARLKEVVKGLQAVRALGVNVTIPYKQAVMNCVDELSPEAGQIGAVNTLVFRDQKIIGCNTDGLGFLKSLPARPPLRGKNAVLLGSGGGGRAVAVSLVLAGVAQLSVSEPEPRRRNSLIRHLRALGCPGARGVLPDSPELQSALREADLLVNATPLGLKPGDPLPLPEAWMPEKRCAMDLVYGRSTTRFLKLAARRGNRIVPGWRMLLHQGAEAFRLWTGRQPPVEVMERALRKAGGMNR